mmetsp:Transcript_28899/g.74158  ORF Transcript_28899/g.74158 Transcript_28899/m.74158 type:complete len:122 (-) Transcript_28899:7-372(-)
MSDGFECSTYHVPRNAPSLSAPKIVLFSIEYSAFRDTNAKHIYSLQLPTFPSVVCPAAPLLSVWFRALAFKQSWYIAPGQLYHWTGVDGAWKGTLPSCLLALSLFHVYLNDTFRLLKLASS